MSRIFPFIDPAKRCEFIFGQPMKPCPKCGSYKLIYQTPVMETQRASSAMMLKGPVFIMCKNCFHNGPSIDCSGRTSQEVGRDKFVAAEIKRLWNSQTAADAVKGGQK